MSDKGNHPPDMAAMSDEDQKKLTALQRQYKASAHAMQTGVKLELVSFDAQARPAEQSQGSPKHLRVGVNSNAVSNGALVELLIEKGVFSRLEYWAKLAEGMEREVASYEAMLGGIKLG